MSHVQRDWKARRWTSGELGLHSLVTGLCVRDYQHPGREGVGRQATQQECGDRLHSGQVPQSAASTVGRPLWDTREAWGSAPTAQCPQVWSSQGGSLLSARGGGVRAKPHCCPKPEPRPSHGSSQASRDSVDPRSSAAHHPGSPGPQSHLCPGFMDPD